MKSIMMKNFIRKSACVLMASVIILSGCGNSANVKNVDPVQTEEIASEPSTFVFTIEMAHHGVNSIAGAFVENKITAERAIDDLAGVANMITKAVDSLHVSKKKKKKLTGAVGVKREEDGMCILEGDIQDLRSYLADYTVGQADIKVVIKMINRIKKTDYTKFNK